MRVALLPLVLLACTGPDGADTKEPAPTDLGDDDTTVGDDDDTVGDDDDDVLGDDDDDDDTPVEPNVLSSPAIVYGLPNVDNNYDYSTPNFFDDDLTAFEVVLSEQPATQLRLTLTGTAFARVWFDGAVVLQADESEQVEATVPWVPGTLELWAEFGLFDVDADLLLEELDADGNVLASSESRLRASPLLLNHHLLDSEVVVAMSTPALGNQAFIAGYEDALGADFESFSGNPYQQDVWVQDEIEFATGHLPDGRRMDAVIDSIRDRGLDDYPEDRWQGEQFGVARFGRGIRANSLDSFGNLEATPPIDGYPLGRIYYGSVPGQPSAQPKDSVLFDYLADQVVQDPIELDTSWLCVGHVDEYLTFIPDPSAPRGFRLLFTDTDTAWDFLDTLDPSMALPRYAGRRNHGIDTVGELVNDAGLRALNDDLQADHLDPVLDQLIAELNLTPDEIILFPGIFEEPSYCGRSVASLIPGMINLVSTNFGGQDKVFMADPFLREDVGDQGSDPLIAYVRSILPATTEAVFLDDWETYHLALGEVHCGSNVVRTPAGDWWTDDVGGHL